MSERSETRAAEATVKAMFLELAGEPTWVDELSREIAHDIHLELPELAADEDLATGTVQSTRSVVLLFLDALLSDRPVGDLEPPAPAVAFAGELVRRGVPLDALLRSYFLGHASFSRWWIAYCRRTLAEVRDVAAAVEYTSLRTFDYLGALTRGLVVRYGEERERWVRSAAAVRAETVRALLDDQPVDLRAAEARLGYPLERRHLALVAWREDGAADPEFGILERALAEMVESSAPRPRLVVPMGQHLAFAWMTVDPAATRQPDFLPPKGTSLALGLPGDGIAGFIASHEQALHARRVARLSPGTAPPVTDYHAVALVALCAADRVHAGQFVAAELGDLAEDTVEARGARRTVRAYLEEQGSTRRAARRLGVHENTVANRIRAVEARFGVPINSRPTESLVALRLLDRLLPGDR